MHEQAHQFLNDASESRKEKNKLREFFSENGLTLEEDVASGAEFYLELLLQPRYLGLCCLLSTPHGPARENLARMRHTLDKSTSTHYGVSPSSQRHLHRHLVPLVLAPLFLGTILAITLVPGALALKQCLILLNVLLSIQLITGASRWIPAIVVLGPLCVAGATLQWGLFGTRIWEIPHMSSVLVCYLGWTISGCVASVLSAMTNALQLVRLSLIIGYGLIAAAVTMSTLPYVWAAGVAAALLLGTVYSSVYLMRNDEVTFPSGAYTFKFAISQLLAAIVVGVPLSVVLLQQRWGSPTTIETDGFVTISAIGTAFWIGAYRIADSIACNAIQRHLRRVQRRTGRITLGSSPVYWHKAYVAFSNTLAHHAFETSVARHERCATGTLKQCLVAPGVMDQYCLGMRLITPDVFISFSSADRELVTQIRGELDKAEIGCWIDQERLHAGHSDWSVEIRDAIIFSSAVIICMGPSGIGAYQRQEADLALERRHANGLPVIPLLLPGCQDTPSEMEDLTHIDRRNASAGSLVDGEMIERIRHSIQYARGGIRFGFGRAGQP